MIIENYSTGIRALVNQIQDLRIKRDPAIMDSLHTLLKIGKRMQDNALIGYAYLYLADAYFDHAYPYEDFLFNLTEGMKHQMLAGENELIARSYNLINVDALRHGSNDTGIEALTTARTYADKLSPDMIHSILLHNIGASYNRTGDYQTAYEYRKKALQVAKQHPGDERYFRNIISALHTNAVYDICQNHSGQARDAIEEATRLAHSVSYLEDTLTSPVAIIPHAMLAYEDGDKETFTKAMHKLSDSLADSFQFMDCLDDLMLLLEYLLEREDYDGIAILFPRFQAFLQAEDSSNITRLTLLDFLITFYEKTGDTKAREQAIADFCRNSIEAEASIIKACRFSEEMGHTMARQREEQIRLLEDDIRKRHVAQTDPLTDLPNTVYFMERIEDALDSAIFRHTNLGVSVLTIPVELSVDPSRLQEAVATLTALSTSGVCVTKGEASRLLVLYEDMPNTDILQKATDITEVLLPFVRQQTPQQPSSRSGLFRNFFQKQEPIGIPHGICTGVPTSATGGWEYLSVAADAMQTSRNHHYEITHLTL